MSFQWASPRRSCAPDTSRTVSGLRSWARLGAACLSALTSPALADLTHYVNASNLNPTRTFLATNIPTPYPVQVNIGALAGANTYEFIVIATGNTSGSLALLASTAGVSSGQAIKFEQFPFTGLYGATQYGIADYSYTVASRYNAPVVLAFVANPANQTTRLYVDGVDTGSTVPFSVSLTGIVGLGGAPDGLGGAFDVFEGTIIAAATYNSMLSGADILAHSNAYYIPGPATGAALIFGAIVVGRRRRA